MSYSDIVGTISGLLQFAVACYALRVSRIYGMVRVGWMFFGAFSLLAVVHMLLSVQPFGAILELGVSVNVFYEIISVLLLGTIYQMELLLWKRRQQEKAESQARAREASRSKEQFAQLTAANEELKQAAARFQAEATQREQTLQQSLDQTEKTFQELLDASRQSEEALHEMVAQLQAELAQQKQTLEQAIGEKEKAFLEQLMAGRQAEEEWRTIAGLAQTEVTQQRQAAEHAEKTLREQLAVLRQSETALRDQLALAEAAHQSQAAGQSGKEFQEQLAALRVSEAELRERLARAEAEAHRPKPPDEPVEIEAPPAVQRQPQEPVEEARPDPLAILRQSGIAEVAAMTQSRAAYIARIAKLMCAHDRDMGRFMTRNPQGRRLPKSLSLLTEYLADEQFLLLRRIDTVRKTFENLKQSATAPQEKGRTATAPRLNGVAEQLRASPDGPAGERLSGGDGADYREHLIASVTETGTDSAADDPQSTGRVRSGDAVVGPGTTQS